MDAGLEKIANRAADRLAELAREYNEVRTKLLADIDQALSAAL